MCMSSSCFSSASNMSMLLWEQKKIGEGERLYLCFEIRVCKNIEMEKDGQVKVTSFKEVTL